MTKTDEPVERSLSWFPCLADWTRHPLCRRLRKADKANPDRWMHLVSEAHRCKAKGRLQMSDGTLLTVEDLAYEHDREDEEWKSFLELCESLGMIRIENGCIVILNWAIWNRKAAHDREANTQRQKASRAEVKAKALEASNAEMKAQLEAERAKFEADLAEVRAYLNSPLPSSVPQLSPACPESVTPPVTLLSHPCHASVTPLTRDVLDLDETRLDLDKDKSKSNSACAREALGLPPSPPPQQVERSQRSSEDTKFLFRIRACYQKLLARPLAGRDEELTFTQQLLPAWRKFDASARAEAIEQVAATATVSEDRDLWRTVLADALALLEQARARPEPEEDS